MASSNYSYLIRLLIIYLQLTIPIKYLKFTSLYIACNYFYVMHIYMISSYTHILYTVIWFQTSHTKLQS